MNSHSAIFTMIYGKLTNNCKRDLRWPHDRSWGWSFILLHCHRKKRIQQVRQTFPATDRQRPLLDKQLLLRGCYKLCFTNNGRGIPHVHEALISVSSWDRVVYLIRPKQLVDVHFGRGVPHTQKLDPILNPSVSSKMLFTPSGVLGQWTRL